MPEPDATLESDLTTFAAVLTGQERPEQARDDGRLVLRGDPTAVERLLEALPSPELASVPPA